MLINIPLLYFEKATSTNVSERANVSWCLALSANLPTTFTHRNLVAILSKIVLLTRKKKEKHGSIAHSLSLSFSCVALHVYQKRTLARAKTSQRVKLSPVITDFPYRGPLTDVSEYFCAYAPTARPDVHFDGRTFSPENESASSTVSSASFRSALPCW